MRPQAGPGRTCPGIVHLEATEADVAARKQYLLRIDPELWAEVEKWAADELRSVNAQVEYVLREAVRKRAAAVAPATPPAGDREA